MSRSYREINIAVYERDKERQRQREVGGVGTEAWIPIHQTACSFVLTDLCFCLFNFAVCSAQNSLLLYHIWLIPILPRQLWTLSSGSFCQTLQGVSGQGQEPLHTQILFTHICISFTQLNAWHTVFTMLGCRNGITWSQDRIIFVVTLEKFKHKL